MVPYKESGTGLGKVHVRSEAEQLQIVTGSLT